MTLVRILAISSVLALAACSGGETPPPVDDGTKPTETTAKPDDKPIEMTPDQLAADSENVALVPSPVETQKALESSGIDKKLGDLIVDRGFGALSEDDLDDAAVQTGVEIADMMLTVKTASNEQLVARLSAIREGMGVLRGGTDIDRILVDLSDRVKADAVDRDELLKELDELTGPTISELEFNGKKRIVPLIEAGSWLEGANLVARAALDAQKDGAADALLKQPAVVAYFQQYVKEEGAEKAPAAVTQKLESSLGTLAELAKKDSNLTTEDLETVKKVTEDVLALL